MLLDTGPQYNNINNFLPAFSHDRSLLSDASAALQQSSKRDTTSPESEG